MAVASRNPKQNGSGKKLHAKSTQKKETSIEGLIRGSILR